MSADLFILFVAIINMFCCAWKLIFSTENKMFLDPLTGLYNRHYLSKISLLEDSGDYFYVVFADIDFFKKVNDTYGHDAGDEVLVNFANLLKHSFKFSQDKILRWGGEEFVIFIKVKDKEIFTDNILKEKLEKIKDKIENMVINNNSDQIQITASFGVCTNTSLLLEERISFSDQALYYSKENGRNRITFFKDIESLV